MGVKTNYLTGLMEIRKSLGVGMLNDYYGSLLTEYQTEIVTLYYDYDLSLAEIAERYGISRQGVRDVIVRSEQKLNEYEQKLGLVAKLSKVAAELQELAGGMGEGGTKERLDKIIKEVKEI